MVLDLFDVSEVGIGKFAHGIVGHGLVGELQIIEKE
jgi:hypothetical protein